MSFGTASLCTDAEARKLRSEADALALQAAGHEPMEMINTRLASVVGALNRLEETMHRELPGRANLGAVVRELAQRTPESIELLSFRVVRSGDETTARITGFAFGVDGQTELERYVETLGECPLLDELTLGDVQIGRLEDEFGEQFTATMSLVLTPRDMELTAVAAGGEETP